jgi:hypothetical protein
MTRLQWWWYRLRGGKLSCKVAIFQTCEWEHTYSDRDRPFWVVVGDGETRNFGVTKHYERRWGRWVRVRP